MLCQITFVLAVVLGIATALLLVITLLNKKTGKEDCIFLLTGYVILLVSFAAFVIIYPYTCSSDFRYVAICLVYITIGLGLGNKHYLTQSVIHESRPVDKIMAVSVHMINGGILTLLLLVNVVYVFWGRW